MADFDPVSYMMGQKAGPGGGGGSSTLSGLTDVDISNPTDGQVLVYNAETGKWENGAASGGVDVFWVAFKSSVNSYSFLIPTCWGAMRSPDDDIFLTSSVGGEVTDQADAVVGFVNIGFPIYISLNDITFSNLDESVLPTTAGDVELDINTGSLIVRGDGSFTAAGLGGD